ncbi:MAG: HD domain-containing protein [Planctomycetota bacterium]
MTGQMEDASGDPVDSRAGDRLWRRAASFAAQMHQHQMRKDRRTPYVAHPARVAMTVRDTFGVTDPAAIAAAFLHDTIEDTPADYDDIDERFGSEIARLVAALTKNMLLPEQEREADYDARLTRADWRARLIKLADVLDNAEDIETRPDARSPAVTRRHVDRIDRILKMAEPDTRSHAEVTRAVVIVKAARAELVDRAG